MFWPSITPSFKKLHRIMEFVNANPFLMVGLQGCVVDRWVECGFVYGTLDLRVGGDHRRDDPM